LASSIPILSAAFILAALRDHHNAWFTTEHKKGSSLAHVVTKRSDVSYGNSAHNEAKKKAADCPY
jgi:hypothetical protein